MTPRAGIELGDGDYVVAAWFVTGPDIETDYLCTLYRKQGSEQFTADARVRLGGGELWARAHFDHEGQALAAMRAAAHEVQSMLDGDLDEMLIQADVGAFLTALSARPWAHSLGFGKPPAGAPS